MKRSLLFPLVLLVLSFTISQAQDKKDMPPGMPNQEEMMRKMAEAATPGEMQKKLDMFVGSWETSVKMWMAGPDAPPEMSRGTAELKWMLDGRFLYQEVKGTMMGQAFNGFGYIGFDNMDKAYEFYWIDNTSTAMFNAEGSVDQSGKVFTFIGKTNDPVTGEHDKNVKYFMSAVDKDTFMFEFFDPSMGDKGKMGEITYSRKK